MTSNITVCFGISVKELGLPKKNGGDYLPQHAVCPLHRCYRCHVPQEGFFLSKQWRLFKIYLFLFCGYACFGCMYVGVQEQHLSAVGCSCFPALLCQVQASIPPCVQWFSLLSVDFSPSFDHSGLVHLSSLAHNLYLWQMDKRIYSHLSHMNLFFTERLDSDRVIFPKTQQLSSFLATCRSQCSSYIWGSSLMGLLKSKPCVLLGK